MTEPVIKDVDEARRRIERVLERIRPALRADGGDFEGLDVTPEGRVTLHLVGTCGGCPMSMMTLKQGIERVIKNEVPEVTSVEAV